MHLQIWPVSLNQVKCYSSYAGASSMIFKPYIVLQSFVLWYYGIFRGLLINIVVLAFFFLNKVVPYIYKDTK